MAQIEAYLLTLLTVLVGHVKSEYCDTNNGDYYYRHCDYGCCGSVGSQYCCDYIYTGYSGGAIAGIVVGSLAGLAVLIGAIVCCCCLQRRRATNGQILYAQANPGFTMTTGTTTINGMQMPTTQLPPGMYAPAYAPQMAGYTPTMPVNAGMNNQYGVPPPAYDQAAKT